MDPGSSVNHPDLDDGSDAENDVARQAAEYPQFD
jgi:hypothetical protein